MGVAAVPFRAGEEPSHAREPFRHEARFYSVASEFVEQMSAFIREGLAEGEPVLVLVVGPKIEWLRAELGDDAERVLWGDMADIGRNPGRIISVWREFVAESMAAGGRRVRGIGEPIWAERTAEELVESQRHEALINLAFTGVPAWVLCPYDLDSLDPSVIDEAYRSHPFVSAGGIDEFSDTYRDLEEIACPFDDPLLEPSVPYESMTVTLHDLSRMRAVVEERARAFGLSRARVDDLVLAVNEVATNSIRHAQGEARLRIWTEEGQMIAEVADEGEIDLPLAGRQRPSLGDDSGYGLWLANQLCDLVQLRSFPNGSVVRLRVSA